MRALAISLVLSFVCFPGLLAAEEAGSGGPPERTWVVPGPEGFLSTWRVFAASHFPLPAESEARLGTFCEEEEEGGRCRPPARFIAQARETMTLSTVAQGGLATVYLGARVWTPRRTTVYLLLSVRGGVAVLLDGETVTEHRSSRLRSDEAIARLDLGPGDHSLLLRFTRPGRWGWQGAVRVLDERFRPGAGAARFSIGRLDEDDARGLSADATRFEESHVLGDEGPEVVVRALLPGGGVARPVTIELDGERLLEPGERLHETVIEHREPMPARGRQKLRGTVEGRRVRLGRLFASDRRVLQAAARLREVLPSTPEASKAPFEWRIAELERIVADRDEDGAWRGTLSFEARRLAKAVERGQDPFGRVRGYTRMGFRSELDDTAQYYELFVPFGYRHDGDRRWPLVITLHGFSGNAGDYFRNTFGLARNYDAGETLLAHGRHGEAPTKGPMFVIAPTGRGQAMYRHAGEMDVREALADVQRRFRIDPSRIYITGGSMGGTGATYLPYRSPDVYAASAALAGYHDQRVRVDTNHAGLSDLERYLQAVRGDIDWAENGQYLHTLLVRGTRDRPLAWTRRLARRLEELGYPYEHREPVARHNVWTMTYAGGRIFRYLARYSRPENPREIRFRTARERTQRSYWVTVDERARADAFADVHATVGEDGAIHVETEATRALTLAPSEELVPAGPLSVEIDGDRVTGPRPLSLHRTTSGTWEVATRDYPLPGHKRSGASGPIRDVYHDPLIFVVGTQDPSHTLINRMVARHWANPKGWVVSYRIVDDVDVTDEMIKSHSLVLVGPPSSNSLVRRWAGQLPIQIEEDSVRVGPRCYSGLQVGTAFVAPNPEAPGRSLLVLAGPWPLGTWRTMFLPDILPDYVVVDETIAPARDQWSAGGSGGAYLEEGLFAMDWSVPDRVVPQGPPAPPPAEPADDEDDEDDDVGEADDQAALEE